MRRAKSQCNAQMIEPFPHLWVCNDHDIAATAAVPTGRSPPRVAKHFEAVAATATVATPHADASLVDEALVPFAMEAHAEQPK